MKATAAEVTEFLADWEKPWTGAKDSWYYDDATEEATSDPSELPPDTLLDLAAMGNIYWQGSDKDSEVPHPFLDPELTFQAAFKKWQKWKAKELERAGLAVATFEFPKEWLTEIETMVTNRGGKRIR